MANYVIAAETREQLIDLLDELGNTSYLPERLKLAAVSILPHIKRSPETEVVLPRADIKALYVEGASIENFSGSDEWDLNSAFQDGFIAGLDRVRGLSR